MIRFFSMLIITALLFMPVSVQAALVHRVNQGENVYQIAGEYGVTAGEIIRLNNLRTPEKIFMGQVLIIPEKEAPYFYRVKKGDTLFKISRRLGISVNELARVNGLKDIEELVPNQPLYIPPKPKTYQVKSGDTLFKIALRFDITLKRLMEFNNIKEGEVLEAGRILKIPFPEGKKVKIKDPQYSKKFPGTFYLKGSTKDYKIALTFDDGPDEKFTPQIIEILNNYGVPATFFTIGQRVQNCPEVVKEIIASGHILGNHSWSHVALNKLNKKGLKKEVKKTENIIEKIAGINTRFIRPPFGELSDETIKSLKEMDYKVIFWTVDSRDWSLMDVDQILINTLPKVRKDCIILFHSAGGEGHDLSATVKVLPEIINTLRMNGYEFVPLNELLGTQAYM